MDTNLTPEQQQVIDEADVSIDVLLRVKRMVETFGGIDNVVAAVSTLSEVRKRHQDRVNDSDVAAIQRGIDDVDAGRFSSLEDAKAEIDQMLADKFGQ